MIPSAWSEAEAPPPAYTCAVCGGAFAVEDVYDQQGTIVCKACVESQSAPAAGAPEPGVCAGCGTELLADQAEQVDGQLMCPSCAMAAAARASILPTAGPPRRGAQAKKSSGIGAWVIAGGVVAAIVIVAALVIRNSANRQSSSPSSPSPLAKAIAPPSQGVSAQPQPRPSDRAANAWEQSNGARLATLRQEASGLAANGDLTGASARYQELLALEKAAPQPGNSLVGQIRHDQDAWDAVRTKLAAAAAPAPITTAPAQIAPQPVATDSGPRWEQQHGTQIAQLLSRARAAGNDDFKAALAYQQLFDLVGGHMSDISDPALKQQIDSAAASRAKLLTRIKSSPQAMTLTAQTLLASGLEALQRRRFQAAQESLSDARKLFDRNIKIAQRVKDPDYLTDLHALAVVYLRTKQVPKAGELFADTAPLSKAVEREPTRQLIINRATVDIIQRTMAVRAAKTIKEYMDRHPNQLDEQMINLLGTAIAVGEEHAGSRSFLNQLAQYYAKLNDQLEKARPGEKRWGVQWLPAAEAQMKIDEQRKAIQAAQRLTQETNAAFNEWERQKQLYQPSGPDRLRHTSKANVDAAEARFHGLQAAADQARRQIPSAPWLTEPEPVLPMEPPPAVLVSAQPVHSEPTTPEPPPLTSPEGSGPPPAPEVAPAPSSPPVIAPTVERHSLAFAIDKLRLLTAADVVGDAKQVRLTDSQAGSLQARVIAKQDQLALLEVDSSQTRGLPYLNLASSFSGGPVRCAAIPEENIFVPEPKLLTGEAAAPPSEGEWFVSLAEHPRLPGSPLLDSSAQVVGAVFPATRDDPRAKLRAVTLAQIRQFLSANSALPAAPSANPDPSAVFEVTVEEQ